MAAVELITHHARGLFAEKFKPTRRVREAPGGDNNMWGVRLRDFLPALHGTYCKMSP